MAQGRKTGGRQKGTPNKATAAKQAALDAAAGLIPPEIIDRLTPAEYLDAVWKALAKSGEMTAALKVAIEAAPYFNAKKVAKAEETPASNEAPRGFVDGPPVAESMDEWSQRAKDRTPPVVVPDAPQDG